MLKCKYLKEGVSMENITIIKKDGTLEPFKAEKIKKAVSKSASRVMVNFTEQDLENIVNTVISGITERNLKEVTISQMHNFVEGSLETHFPAVAKSYRDYRNYKQDFVHMLDEVYQKTRFPNLWLVSYWLGRGGNFTVLAARYLNRNTPVIQ